MTAAPPPPPAAAPAPVPGKTLGIVALVVAIFFNVIGLILGIVALVQSRKAGYKNGFAVAAIIVGAVLTIVAIIVTISVISVIGFAAEAYQACEAANFTGTVMVGGNEISCTTVSR